MTILPLLLVNLAVTAVLFCGLWYAAQRTRDPSFVDGFWAFGMVLLAWTSFALTDGALVRKLALTGLCTLWGLRLGLHLFSRWQREGKDRRYEALVDGTMAKRGWGFGRTTALFVFGPQALLLWVTCLPVQLGQISASPEGLGVLALAGLALAVFGIGFETLADQQLARFREDPANAGQCLDTGLWAWSRHPNYFGEACTWWGLWLIAAETMPGLFAVIGPVFLTFTLTRWSGAPLLERGLRKSRPDYADYVARTSGFIPWPPRRSRP